MDSRRHLPVARWRCGRSAIRGGEWPAVGQEVVWRLAAGARDALGEWAEWRAAAPEDPAATPAAAPPEPTPDPADASA
eukprot:8075499-Alexandrium_andersonii.AAC.1